MPRVRVKESISPAILSVGAVASDTIAPQDFAPALQAQDGTFLGALGSQLTGTSLGAVDQNGNVKWSLPGYLPMVATSDNGLVAQSFSGQFVNLDQNGAATGQIASQFANGSPSWLGNRSYSINSDAILTSKVSPLIPYAGTFAALLGGNQSGNGTPIQQVLTNQPQGDQKQLPDLSQGVFCTPLVTDLPPNPTCGNVNAIELITDKSPGFIFQKYIQTFLPAIVVGNNTNNDVMIFTAPGNAPINVTGPAQKLTIALEGIGSLGQGPFSVLTERFDPVNHVIAVVTLKGHPLAGWRYWRVYSIRTNDVVIETGAYDQPGPGLKNYIGYYLGRVVVIKGWQHYLQFIQNDLRVPQGSNLQGTLGGRQINTYRFDHNALLEGYWDYFGDYTNYFLNNVCLSTSCN